MSLRSRGSRCFAAYAFLVNFVLVLLCFIISLINNTMLTKWGAVCADGREEGLAAERAQGGPRGHGRAV